MTDRFAYTLLKTDGGARLGEISTPRGIIRTPAFMPVGTAATVKAVYPDQVSGAGADMILANTYHLMLRPGAERVAKLGGLHKFMRWHRPILTDCGGFQVMSLSKLRKITEGASRFNRISTARRHMLSPERSIEIQCILGADIQMQFDECMASRCLSEVERAMGLSLRLGGAFKRAFERTRQRRRRTGTGVFRASCKAEPMSRLRGRSAEALVAMDFPGYAVGGLAVGEAARSDDCNAG